MLPGQRHRVSFPIIAGKFPVICQCAHGYTHLNAIGISGIKVCCYRLSTICRHEEWAEMRCPSYQAYIATVWQPLYKQRYVRACQ